MSACIIGVLAATLILGGCSAVRLGYNTSPTLAYWWLDSYFDFDGEQSLRVRSDLQTVLDWHRKEELPQLVQTLKDLQTMAPKPVTAEQVCQLVEELQTRVQATLDRVAPTIAAIAPTLQPAQLEHISREFEKRNRKWRAEWIEGTLAERTDRRVKQIVERAESFYGTLEPAQLAIVRSHVDTSSFTGPRQYKEMQRRHQDAIQVLKELGATGFSSNQATEAIRGLLERSLRAPNPEYRQYMDRLTTESCTAMAALHNSSSTSQRSYLVQTLRGYEEDARALAGQKPEKSPVEQSPTPF
jgi:hypothetical protein